MCGRNKYNQYLNCRGDTSPHRDLASPHRDLGFLPSRVERWDEQRKNSQPGLKDLQISCRKWSQIVAKIFFLGLHLISGKNEFNFRRRQ